MTSGKLSLLVQRRKEHFIFYFFLLGWNYCDGMNCFSNKIFIEGHIRTLGVGKECERCY